MMEDAKALSGAGLVSWLVANTEDLVGVAEELERRAGGLEPAVPKESVIRLCRTVRQSAVEMTLALLDLLPPSDDAAAESGTVRDGVGDIA